MPAHIVGVGGTPKTRPLARAPRPAASGRAGWSRRSPGRGAAAGAGSSRRRSSRARRGTSSAAAIGAVPVDREAFDGNAERQHHERGRGEVDADRRAQVAVGAELALVERARGDADAAPRRRRAGWQRDRARRRPRVADDERDAGRDRRATPSFCSADSRSCSQRETISAVSSGCSARIERGDPGRQAPALRVVAAAEVAGVAEQAGDRDVAPLRPASAASARAGRRRASRRRRRCA